MAIWQYLYNYKVGWLVVCLELAISYLEINPTSVPAFAWNNTGIRLLIALVLGIRKD